MFAGVQRPHGRAASRLKEVFGLRHSQHSAAQRVHRLFVPEAAREGTPFVHLHTFIDELAILSNIFQYFFVVTTKQQTITTKIRIL